MLDIGINSDFQTLWLYMKLLQMQRCNLREASCCIGLVMKCAAYSTEDVQRYCLYDIDYQKSNSCVVTASVNQYDSEPDLRQTFYETIPVDF